MKKLIILSALSFVLAAGVNAQDELAMVKNDSKDQGKEDAGIKSEKKEERKMLRKLRREEVSQLSKTNFFTDFGNIPVISWEATGFFDEATFSKDGQIVTAFYDDKSMLVGTTVDKEFADLPGAARQYINEKYSDYTVSDVLFFDDNELNETDMILYGQQFDDEDSYFVELKKDNKKIVLQVNMDGHVSYYTRLK